MHHFHANAHSVMQMRPAAQSACAQHRQKGCCAALSWSEELHVRACVSAVRAVYANLCKFTKLYQFVGLQFDMTSTLISLIFLSNVRMFFSFINYLCFYFSCRRTSSFTANVFLSNIATYILIYIYVYIDTVSNETNLKWGFSIVLLIELQGKQTHQARQLLLLVCSECQFILGVTSPLVHVTELE